MVMLAISNDQSVGAHQGAGFMQIQQLVRGRVVMRASRAALAASRTPLCASSLQGICRRIMKMVMLTLPNLSKKDVDTCCHPAWDNQEEICSLHARNGRLPFKEISPGACTDLFASSEAKYSGCMMRLPNQDASRAQV